jgi:hypothetical protein
VPGFLFTAPVFEEETTMDIWMKILMAAALVMLLVVLWPAYKHWSEHGPKAGAGDWRAAIIPLLAVIGFVILLVLMVR